MRFASMWNWFFFEFLVFLFKWCLGFTLQLFLKVNIFIISRFLLNNIYMIRMNILILHFMLSPESRLLHLFQFMAFSPFRHVQVWFPFVQVEPRWHLTLRFGIHFVFVGWVQQMVNWILLAVARLILHLNWHHLHFNFISHSFSFKIFGCFFFYFVLGIPYLLIFIVQSSLWLSNFPYIPCFAV